MQSALPCQCQLGVFLVVNGLIRNLKELPELQHSLLTGPGTTVWLLSSLSLHSPQSFNSYSPDTSHIIYFSQVSSPGDSGKGFFRLSSLLFVRVFSLMYLCQTLLFVRQCTKVNTALSRNEGRTFLVVVLHLLPRPT